WLILRNGPRMTAAWVPEMDNCPERVRSRCYGEPTPARQAAVAAGRLASAWTAWTLTPASTWAWTKCPAQKRPTPHTLRMIARRLEKEDISKEDLKKNLEYAASVLENVYIDEARRRAAAGSVWILPFVCLVFSCYVRGSVTSVPLLTSISLVADLAVTLTCAHS
ncbi:hypothetical protein BaRGS_00014375, partial [Batillaria attramentaria]